jgi:glucosamine--fructose-6-phosphate aminotransferase (isomerizing)
VAAAARREVSEILLEGLRRLEYRGYDSAGMALVDNEHNLQLHKRQGKVAELEKAQALQPYLGCTGIAHTRWATHGEPSGVNAHPHISGQRVALVHNGIIENHESLRRELSDQDYAFSSATDSEVIVHLLHRQLADGSNLLEAMRATLSRLEGAYALAAVDVEHPDEVVAARQGSPLVIGVGIGENFLASDQMALRQVTDRFIYLEEGDLVQISPAAVQVFAADGSPVQRAITSIDAAVEVVELGHFDHYMIKEIHEQPQALAATLKSGVGESFSDECFGAGAAALFDRVRHVQIVACGACPTPAPDEFLGSLVISNVDNSSLVRECDLVFLTRAGAEIGVASTKAFTTQLLALLMLTALLGRRRAMSQEQLQGMLEALHGLPEYVQQALELDPAIQQLSEAFIPKHHALFLGRGIQYPVAMEGALKLKEISYIHAEAYPAGELKHGPLALVDDDMPVVAVAPNDELLEKLKSNLEEVRSRGGELFVFADREAGFVNEPRVRMLAMPHCPEILKPIVYTVALQLLSYHVAVQKGTDVDKPRNLAKSVTVE